MSLEHNKDIFCTGNRWGHWNNWCFHSNFHQRTPEKTKKTKNFHYISLALMCTFQKVPAGKRRASQVRGMIKFWAPWSGILYFGRFWVDPSHDSTNLLYVVTATGKTNELSYDNSYSRNIWFFIFLQNCKNLPSARQGPRDRNSWKMWKIIFLFNHCQIQQPQLCLYQFPPTGHQMVKSKNAFELPFCGCFEIIWWFVWIRLNMLYWSWLVFVLSFNWGSEAFICPQFLFVQLVDLRKVRTENLKFRTDIQESRLSYGWFVSNTVND